MAKDKRNEKIRDSAKEYYFKRLFTDNNKNFEEWFKYLNRQCFHRYKVIKKKR